MEGVWETYKAVGVGIKCDVAETLLVRRTRWEGVPRTIDTVSVKTVSVLTLLVRCDYEGVFGKVGVRQRFAAVSRG